MKCRVPSCKKRTPGGGSFLCIRHWLESPKRLRDAAERAYLAASQRPGPKTTAAKRAARRTLEDHWGSRPCRLCGQVKIRYTRALCDGCKKFLRQSEEGKACLDAVTRLNREGEGAEARIAGTITRFTSIPEQDRTPRRKR